MIYPNNFLRKRDLFFKTEFWKKLLKKYDDYPCKRSEIYIRTNDTNSKFYVGFTRNYNRRYTNKFKERNLFKKRHNITESWLIFPIPADMDNMVLEYLVFEEMQKIFGKENVRGAHLTREILPDKYDIIKLKKAHFNGLCYKCYNNDHYAYNCPN